MGEHFRPVRVRVLVCGERLRGDDGAAVLAAEMLPPEVRALAEVREVGQLTVGELLDVPERVALIVADAAMGVAAGRIVTLPLGEVARSAGSGATPASSHALPPDQVLALADELRGSPTRGLFVGIGGLQFALGAELSREVAAVLPDYARAIADAITSAARSQADPA
jgi:hydrogenase maturation protease